MSSANQPKPLNIFFSYPHDRNSSLVLRLKLDLEARGHSVWFDQDKIKVGDDWRSRITNGIQGSHRGVAFLSKHSTRDPGVCLNEIAIGMAEGGGADFWVSVLVEPFDIAQPPLSVTAITWLQWLQMDNWEQYANDVGWYKAKIEQLIKVIENPAEATRNADLEKLRNILNPIAFSHELGLHIPNFIGRQWILDRVHNWLESEKKSRVFRIEGGPGMGKTAIALKLAHRDRSQIIAMHLCRHNQQDSRSAARMVMSLAFQMATRLPDYRARLLSRPILNDLQKPNLDGMAGILWRELIAIPMADQISRQRVAIVIDALDEATDDGNNEIVSLLAKDLDQLPPWVGIILTGRPDVEVVTKLSRFTPTVLRGNDPENLADLKLYIDKWLAKKVDAGELTSNQRAVAEEILLSRCSGSMLYISKIREAVDFGDCSLTDPHRLPSSLADTYALFFDRRFGSNSNLESGLWSQSVRPILQLVIASPEPLPLKVVRKILLWDNLEDVENNVLNIIGSFFTKNTNETIGLFHKSILDWLCDKQASGKFFVSRKQGHSALASFCWSQCERNVLQNMPLREWSKSYSFRNGVRHLLECGRFAEALLLLDYLEKNKEAIPLREHDNIRHSAKLLLSVLGGKGVSEDEAKKMDPFKLQKILEGVYMTAACRGGIQLLLEYHQEKWPEVLKRFIETGDYVLRNTIAEAIANEYLKYGSQSRLSDIYALVEHLDINYRELGSYALGFVYSEKPSLIDIKYLNKISNGETYQFRSIVGDLMIGLTVKEYGTDLNNSEVRNKQLENCIDGDSLFWNPVWDFNKMDVSWLRGMRFFIYQQQPTSDSSIEVHKAYSSISQMELLRINLINDRVLSSCENNPIESYYNLANNLDFISEAIIGQKKNYRLKDIFTLLFAHPLWKVGEEAASVLAFIVDEDPESGIYISELFEHDSWRVNYGAAEAAFLVRATNRSQLFRKAIWHFYMHPEPLLRGNCAENLVAWILDSSAGERGELMREFEEPISYWLKDLDCWVLDHIYHLFHSFYINNDFTEGWRKILDEGVSDILKREADENEWYKLDRNAFLIRIERRKRRTQKNTVSHQCSLYE